jgi:hypothetical protein
MSPSNTPRLLFLRLQSECTRDFFNRLLHVIWVNEEGNYSPDQRDVCTILLNERITRMIIMNMNHDDVHEREFEEEDPIHRIQSNELELWNQ